MSDRERQLYTSTPHYVRTPEELDASLAALAQSPFIAIDTEFLREKTYFPKFCLLQMAHDDYCALIDVLALPSLEPLMKFLDSEVRVKVLHAAHQDLEVLALANGAANGVPLMPISGPFFDTQIAAAFLDMPANIGYADLVQRRLNLTLDKGQSRTDWSRRPLSSEQLKYAAADVIYLAQIYHDLQRELANIERAAWLSEEVSQLQNPKLYATDPVDAWQRMRGLEQLHPEQRAVAKALAAWREQRAVVKDLPRSWVLADDVLRQIAERLPTTVEQLAEVRGIPRSLAEKRGDELLGIMEAGKANSANEKPASDFRPSATQQKNIRSLMDLVRKHAARLRVTPERLATRRDIESLVYSGRKGVFASGWRNETFGAELLKFAEAEHMLGSR